MLQCKAIKLFWLQIFNLLSNFLGYTSTPNAALALLNIHIASILLKQIVFHILTAARLCLATEWKSTFCALLPIHVEI